MQTPHNSTIYRTPRFGWPGITALIDSATMSLYHQGRFGWPGITALIDSHLAHGHRFRCFGWPGITALIDSMPAICQQNADSTQLYNLPYSPLWMAGNHRFDRLRNDEPIPPGPLWMAGNHRFDRLSSGSRSPIQMLWMAGNHRFDRLNASNLPAKCRLHTTLQSTVLPALDGRESPL